MKRRKWVSLFLTTVLLITVVANTENPVFASETLGEETVEETKKAEDESADTGEEAGAKTEDEKAADAESKDEKAVDKKTDAQVTDAGAANGKEETEGLNASDQVPAEDAGVNSADKADGLDTAVEGNAKEADGMEEVQIPQKSDISKANLAENRALAAEIEQPASEEIESVENAVLESPDQIEDVETTEEEVVPQAGDIASGSSGNISWVIDADGKLTVSGEGAFSSELWRDYRDKVISVDLSGVDTSTVTDMSRMFSYCSNLISIDLSGLDTSNVTDMRGMFFGCNNLKSLDLSRLDTSKAIDMRSMFCGCSGLERLNLSGLDTSNVIDMESMFNGCGSLKNLDLSRLNTCNVINMRDMFYNCHNLESLDLSGLNTSNVTAMSGMFNRCFNLESLGLSRIDTSNVTDMEAMFADCKSLKSLDISGLNTSNVTDMSAMFIGCESLKSLDISGLNTSNVTDMGNMFYGCKGLESLNLSGIDTSNVIDMVSMFFHCRSLESLDLSGIDTSNVTDMEAMFAWCYNLEKLDISSFDTSNANVNDLFDYSGNLNTIYTPYKTKTSIDLNPRGETYDPNIYTWYLPDGTEVTEIPANLDHSVMLVRRKNPKIITTTADLNMEDVIRVKYVPYSYTVETNNTESDNIVTYSLVEGRLAEGLSLYPATGEIYGVPLETGSFPIRVKAEFSNPEYFPSYADLVLTVIDNTDSNVFNASDPGYELLTPVGEIMSSVFVVTQTGDQLFVSAGAYSEFMDFWLNGQKLIEGEDYTKESGSTRITIRSQTFLNKADKEGVNTLAAEFREGGLFTNPLRRTAQNFYLRIQQNTGNESSGSGYTGGGDSQSSESAIRTTTFAIRLVDAAGNALGGYTVELHSTPKVTRTNQRGIAVFRNVEEGSHTLYVKDARGNILASKVFTLGIGEDLSLDGDKITAKDGAAFTLQLQMTGSTLTLLQVQEGDVYRVIPAQTGDQANPELWLALLALLGVAALAGGLYGKRRNYV